MTRTVRVNATMDESLLARVDDYADRHYEDRSTAIRQLVDFALREQGKAAALEAFRSNRVTLREFARALDLDIWAAHDLLRAEGVPVGSGARSETRASLRRIFPEDGTAQKS